MSAKQWIEKTHAKGIIAKAGRYGGTYAYKDIALELLQNNGVIRILISKEILEIIFRLYLGVNTTWYLHNHFVCDKL